MLVPFFLVSMHFNFATEATVGYYGLPFTQYAISMEGPRIKIRDGIGSSQNWKVEDGGPGIDLFIRITPPSEGENKWRKPVADAVG